MFTRFTGSTRWITTAQVFNSLGPFSFSDCSENTKDSVTRTSRAILASRRDVSTNVNTGQHRHGVTPLLAFALHILSAVEGHGAGAAQDDPGDTRQFQPPITEKPAQAHDGTKGEGGKQPRGHSRGPQIAITAMTA